MAGVTYAVGREPNSTYGETLNGGQVANARWHQFKNDVSAYRVATEDNILSMPE